MATNSPIAIGKIESRAHFSRIAGRQAHSYSPRRQHETRVGERGHNALATLLHLAGRQPDDAPIRQTRRDVDLDADVVSVNPDDGGGSDGGEHAGDYADRHAIHTAEFRIEPKQRRWGQTPFLRWSLTPSARF